MIKKTPSINQSTHQSTQKIIMEENKYVEYNDNEDGPTYKEKHLRYYAYTIILGFALVLVCIAFIIVLLIISL